MEPQGPTAPTVRGDRPKDAGYFTARSSLGSAHDKVWPGGSSRWLWLLLGGLTVAGLLLRLPLSNDSLYADELSTYFVVAGHSLGHVIYLLRDHSIDLNPPLSFVLAWLTQKLGDSAQTLRLTSLLAGTATVPFAYLLGVQTVGRRAALVGATLVALSPYLIFYSTEARPYALLTLLILLTTLTLLRALDTCRPRWWAAYSACACATFYTHYVAVFPLLALFVWAFWTQAKARRALLIATVAAAVGTLPWLPTFLKETHSPGVDAPDILTPFTLHNIRIDLGRLSIGHPAVPLGSVPGDLGVALIAAGLALALLGLAVKAHQRGYGRRPSRGGVLVAVLALATPVEIALYSWLAPHSVWDTNKLIPCLPALMLAVGALVTSIERRLQLVAVGLLVGGFAIGAARTVQPGTQRPNYAAVARFIDHGGPPGSPVLEWPAPTPGPLTALDVAFAYNGSRTLERDVILRVGYPPLDAILRAPPYAPVPAPPVGAVLRQAARLARARDLFVVAFGAGRAYLALGAVQASAPLKRFQFIELRKFSGFVPVFVARFRGPSS